MVDCQETRRYKVQYKAIFKSDLDEWNANTPWQKSTDFVHAQERSARIPQGIPEKTKAAGAISDNRLASLQSHGWEW